MKTHLYDAGGICVLCDNCRDPECCGAAPGTACPGGPFLDTVRKLVADCDGNRDLLVEAVRRA